MAEELHVSIATEQLRETARDIAVKVSALKAVFEDMDMAVKRTEGYWIGEAAEAHREAYRRMSPERGSNSRLSFRTGGRSGRHCGDLGRKGRRGKGAGAKPSWRCDCIGGTKEWAMTG
ncbi:hypothetical protein RJD28_07235 [Oscillospiraceae bacterium NTUH-002-81]|nr:hypothetical protein RJD28_07235 [Oscillospiraceae bacterium NTUH-002-81]